MVSGLFVFQNCSKPIASPNSYSASSSDNGGNTNPPPDGPGVPGTAGTNGTPPGTYVWAAGETFNYLDLPVTLRSQMVDVQLIDGNYAAFTGPKAVAIADNGLGFVRRLNAPATQDDADRTALNACYTITGKPCALLVRGNAWAVSRNDLPNSYTHTLAAPTAIDAASLPFLPASAGSSAAATYNAATNPKALVVSLDGTFIQVAQSANNPIANLDEAKRLAMERCEMAAGAIPCTLFAENNAVVFTPSALNRATVIDYARTQLMTNIPGTRQAAFTAGMQNDYLVNGGATNGIVYISASGAGGYAYNSGNNNATALNNCTALTTAGFPCFRYAVNRALDPLTANLVSLKTYGANLHCKVVPRATCAMHRALGCPAGGQYYTFQAGQVTLQTCN